MDALRVEEVAADIARPWLLKAEKFDVSDGATSQAENEAGCLFIGVWSGDEMVGAFSLRGAGGTVWVVQAGGKLPGRSLALAIMPAVEKVAARWGFRSVAFATKRPGLVEIMSRLGFKESGVIVRKEL